MRSLTTILFTTLPNTLWAALRRFDSKGGWIMSSHVAMSVMLALFPFLLFVVALAGFLSQDVAVEDLIELIFGTWPDEVADPIETEVRNVLEAASPSLITAGGVLALYFASNGVEAVRLAMSQAYRDVDPRPFWKTRLLSLVFVVLGSVAILLFVTFGWVLPLYFSLVADAVTPAERSWLTDARLNSTLTVAVAFGLVAACHKWLPGTAHALSQIWPGVVLTLVLWVAAGKVLAYYMSRFADYSATYAGLAGVMAALIFLYLMAAILILGAEFNGALIDRSTRRRARAAEARPAPKPAPGGENSRQES